MGLIDLRSFQNAFPLLALPQLQKRVGEQPAPYQDEAEMLQSRSGISLHRVATLNRIENK